MKTNETYLPLKRPSAGPFFKSTLAEIYFIIYSYANKDHAKALQNYLTHNPDSPLLLGNIQPGDKIVPSRQESLLSKEARLNLLKRDKKGFVIKRGSKLDVRVLSAEYNVSSLFTAFRTYLFFIFRCNGS